MKVLKKIKPNLSEELQFLGFDKIQPTINKITEDAYKAGECGDTLKYKTLIGAGNKLYALLWYMGYMRRQLDESDENECKADLSVLDKRDCVKEGLRCYSTKVNIDFVTIFDELEELYGIGAHTDCECCKGIGGMIINSEDCKAFIVGSCEANQPIGGDYAIEDYNNDYSIV